MDLHGQEEEFITYAKGVRGLFRGTRPPWPKLLDSADMFGTSKIYSALIHAIYTTNQEDRYQAALLMLWCKNRNEEIEDYIRKLLREHRQVKIK